VIRSARPFTVAVGGFASNSGKTTLICRLLEAFPGWEAIKLTRDHHLHHQSDPNLRCGEEPAAGEPLIRSGRDLNYTRGKDTARFWDAGASNVHWIVSTAAQTGQGIRRAIQRVRSAGVFMEGNSFLRFMDVDVAIVVARSDGEKIKPTALRALEKFDALFLTNSVDGNLARAICETFC
jgi:molybdopterin-guanine dinucleotide biosynthesis protein